MAKRSLSGFGWVAFFALIAVFMLATSLLLAWLLPIIKLGDAGLVDWLNRVAFIIAAIITIGASYYGARACRKQYWFVLWVIAAIIIVVFYILPIV